MGHTTPIHDAGMPALAAEVAHTVELLQRIDERLRDGLARPQFDRVFTVVSNNTVADAAAIHLGMAGLLLCRAWSTAPTVDAGTASTTSSVYLFHGSLSVARCQALGPGSKSTQVVDGCIAVPVNGDCEFLLDNVSDLTAYFDSGATGKVVSQAVSLRVTSLERPRSS